MKKLALLLASLLLVAPLAKASPLFDFSDNAAPNWNGDIYTLGYTFNVAGSYSFNALGVFDYGSDGLASAHAVGVWDANGNLIASTTVSGSGTASDVSASGSGSWVYQSLASTVSLSAGSYTIGAYYGSNSSDPVFYDGQTSGLIQNVAGVSFTGYAFSDFGSGGLTRPGYTGNDGHGFYFGPNLSTVGARGVPDGGSTLLLLGLALTAVVGVRRKFVR